MRVNLRINDERGEQYKTYDPETDVWYCQNGEASSYELIRQAFDKMWRVVDEMNAAIDYVERVKSGKQEETD